VARSRASDQTKQSLPCGSSPHVRSGQVICHVTRLRTSDLAKLGVLGLYRWLTRMSGCSSSFERIVMTPAGREEWVLLLLCETGNGRERCRATVLLNFRYSMNFRCSGESLEFSLFQSSVTMAQRRDGYVTWILHKSNHGSTYESEGYMNFIQIAFTKLPYLNLKKKWELGEIPNFGWNSIVKLVHKCGIDGLMSQFDR